MGEAGHTAHACTTAPPRAWNEGPSRPAVSTLSSVSCPRSGQDAADHTERGDAWGGHPLPALAFSPKSFFPHSFVHWATLHNAYFQGALPNSPKTRHSTIASNLMTSTLVTFTSAGKAPLQRNIRKPYLETSIFTCEFSLATIKNQKTVPHPRR